MVATVRVALVDARHSDVRPCRRGIAEHQTVHSADRISQLQQSTSAAVHSSNRKDRALVKRKGAMVGGSSLAPLTKIRWIDGFV